MLLFKRKFFTIYLKFKLTVQTWQNNCSISDFSKPHMFPNCPSKKIDVLEEAGPMPDERFADEHGVLSILTLNIFFIKKVLLTTGCFV